MQARGVGPKPAGLTLQSCRVPVKGLFLNIPVVLKRDQDGIYLLPLFRAARCYFMSNRPVGTANSIWNRYFSSNGGGQPPGPSAADAQLDKAFDEIRGMCDPAAGKWGA